MEPPIAVYQLLSSLIAYCRIDFDKYGEITAFNNAKARPISLQKTDIADWHAIIYVMGLSKQDHEMAQRLCAALGSENPLTLEEIREDRPLLTQEKGWGGNAQIRCRESLPGRSSTNGRKAMPSIRETKQYLITCPP